jgi:hypothetical protein
MDLLIGLLANIECIDELSNQKQKKISLPLLWLAINNLHLRADWLNLNKLKISLTLTWTQKFIRLKIVHVVLEKSSSRFESSGFDFNGDEGWMRNWTAVSTGFKTR